MNSISLARRFSLLAALCCGATFCMAASANEITIGWAGPAGLPHAKSFQQSAQLAIDEANQRNIVMDGQKLSFKLFVIDDKDNPRFAENAANVFVSKKVSAVIGHYSSDATLAALPIYAKAAIPMITTYSVSPKVTAPLAPTLKTNPYAFQLVGNAALATGYLLDELTQRYVGKRIGMAYSDSTLGKTFYSNLNGAMQKRGAQFITPIEISSSTSDFNAVLSTLQKEKIDILYFAALQAQARALSQRFSQVKTHARLVLSGGLFNPGFFDTADVYAEGTQILMHSKPENQLPGFAKFEKAYVAKYGPPVMPYTITSYDAVNMVIQAIQMGRSASPQKIADTLHTMSYNGVSGTIRFEENGQLASPGFTLYEVQQKKWKPVRTFP